MIALASADLKAIRSPDQSSIGAECNLTGNGLKTFALPCGSCEKTRSIRIGKVLEKLSESKSQTISALGVLIQLQEGSFSS
jgi:hypothetical protein